MNAFGGRGALSFTELLQSATPAADRGLASVVVADGVSAAELCKD